MIAGECVHLENWSANGANLLLVDYEPASTQIKKVKVGEQTIVVNQKEIDAAKQQQNNPSNPNAGNPVNPNTSNVVAAPDKSDPNVRALLSYVTGFARRINYDTDRSVFSSSREHHNLRLYRMMCATHNKLIVGYMLGYVDFVGDVKNLPSYNYWDSYTAYLEQNFKPNGKGVYDVGYIDEIKYVPVNRVGAGNSYWLKFKPNTYPNNQTSWIPAAGFTGGRSLVHVSHPPKRGCPKGQYLCDDYKGSGCVEDSYYEAITANAPTSAPSPTTPPKIPDPITKTIDIFDEQKIEVPPKLAFKKEDVLHLLNPTNIEVTSDNKTLLFTPDSTINQINPNEPAAIEHLINNMAVIKISDSKRGFDKHSKQICINSVGLTKVINGNQNCEF